MFIKINNFKAKIPKYFNQLLEPNYAQEAENLDLNSGTLRPIQRLESLLTISNVSAPRSMYWLKAAEVSLQVSGNSYGAGTTWGDVRYLSDIEEVVESDQYNFWLVSPNDLDVVLAPVVNTETRFFYTDGIRPKYSDIDLASNEGAVSHGTPNREYYTGLPQPNTTLSTSIQGTGTEDAQDVSYFYTFVNGWGGEGIASAITDLETVYDGEYVRLSNIELPPPSHYNIVGIRIYRLSTGSGGNAQYRVLDDLHDNAYVDCIYFTNSPLSDGTGTVSVSGTTVTGDGTDFVNQLNEGDLLLIRDQWFEVDSITDADTLTVTEEASPDIAAGESFEFGSPWTYKEDKGDGSYVIPSADLGEVFPAEDWYEPHSDLKGLRSLPNGVLVGFKDNALYASEPYIPYAWPTEYEKILEHDIVAIGSYKTTVVAATKGFPYVVDVYDPLSMSDQKIFDNQSCLFKESMVSGANFVIYASPDGLYKIGSDGRGLITRNLFRKDQWRSYLSTDLTSPHTTYDKEIIGALYENKYYGFFKGTSDGFMIDLNPDTNQSFMEFSLSDGSLIYDSYTDPVTDTMYLLAKVDSTYYIRYWNGSNVSETYTWKSKGMSFGHYASFSCASIYGNFVNEDTNAKFYADGQLIHTEEHLTDNSVFRLPAVRAKTWEIEITGTDEVYEIRMATSVRELSQNV
jgi:hypothetical protein